MKQQDCRPDIRKCYCLLLSMRNPLVDACTSCEVAAGKPNREGRPHMTVCFVVGVSRSCVNVSS
jgi:hypothetical protein